MSDQQPNDDLPKYLDEDTERYFFVKKAVTLTWIVFVFAMIIGLLGIFCNDLYRNNEFIKAQR